MRRLLILLLIGCIALTGAELMKLKIKQHVHEQMEAGLLNESCDVIFITN